MDNRACQNGLNQTQMYVSTTLLNMFRSNSLPQIADLLRQPAYLVPIQLQTGPVLNGSVENNLDIVASLGFAISSFLQAIIVNPLCCTAWCCI